ncbi:hypothetical protein DY218_27445 [Streptomyces triticagri]|uniref:DNA-binding protein n=1 Tax=Streptomyces triticagri TaxID=2293568 RepID=A0A372LZF8_9ACTN|nr:hypothetical protein [Streptomyces triticagri]RFU83645.1 hypothetical protein DY218_27445 [Streptomyces triticagri]
MTTPPLPDGYTTPDGKPLRIGGLIEVAEVLGLTKQAAGRALKRAGGPGLVAELAMGPVYDLDVIKEWDMERKKTPGPAATKAREV